MEDIVQRPIHKHRKTLTKSQKQVDWDKTKGRCWYFGVNVVSQSDAGEHYAVTQHIDHQDPVIKGGTDDVSNLVIACKDCNYEKGVRGLEEFRKKIIERFRDDFLSKSRYGIIGNWHRYCHSQIEAEWDLQFIRFACAMQAMRLVFYGECVNCERYDYYSI